MLGFEARARLANATAKLEIAGGSVATIEEDFQLSFVAKAGWLPSNETKLYGLAGVSGSRYDVQVPILAFQSEKYNIGLTVGAGMEYALSENWSAKLEYRFTTELQGELVGPVEAEPSTHEVMTGISYRFGGE